MTDPHTASSIFPCFPRPFIVISSYSELIYVMQHVDAASCTFISPPHGGASLGIDWWLHLTKRTAGPSILDCGANAALALEALTSGIDGVVCRNFQAGRLQDYNGRLATDRPATILPLGYGLVSRAKRPC